MVSHTWNPNTQKAKQEEYKFEDSLNFIVTSYLKIKLKGWKDGWFSKSSDLLCFSVDQKAQS